MYTRGKQGGIVHIFEGESRKRGKGNQRESGNTVDRSHETFQLQTEISSPKMVPRRSQMQVTQSAADSKTVMTH